MPARIFRLSIVPSAGRADGLWARIEEMPSTMPAINFSSPFQAIGRASFAVSLVLDAVTNPWHPMNQGRSLLATATDSAGVLHYQMRSSIPEVIVKACESVWGPLPVYPPQPTTSPHDHAKIETPPAKPVATDKVTSPPARRPLPDSPRDTDATFEHELSKQDGEELTF